MHNRSIFRLFFLYLITAVFSNSNREFALRQTEQAKAWWGIMEVAMWTRELRSILFSLRSRHRDTQVKSKKMRAQKKKAAFGVCTTSTGRLERIGWECDVMPFGERTNKHGCCLVYTDIWAYFPASVGPRLFGCRVRWHLFGSVTCLW